MQGRRRWERISIGRRTFSRRIIPSPGKWSGNKKRLKKKTRVHQGSAMKDDECWNEAERGDGRKRLMKTGKR